MLCTSWFRDCQEGTKIAQLPFVSLLHSSLSVHQPTSSPVCEPDKGDGEIRRRREKWEDEIGRGRGEVGEGKWGRGQGGGKGGGEGVKGGGGGEGGKRGRGEVGG